MKLILNKKSAENINFRALNRVLDIENPVIQYNMVFDFGSIPGLNPTDYLSQYANTMITDIQIYSNFDELLLNLEDINAQLVNFTEYLSDDGYSCTATVLVNEPIPEDAESITED